jgi:hypothetical protein
MTTSTRLFLALVLLIQTLRLADAQVCHPCGGAGNDALMFPHIVLEGVGKTCAAISIETAASAPLGSQACTDLQNTYFQRCCSGTQPAGSQVATGLAVGQSIPQVAYVGPNPPCNVCKDGDYPYATSMVMNFLYIGVGSCAQYYVMGKQGLISANMCAPVQFFANEPCGCGQHNPYFNPNHPLWQQAQQAPQSNGNSNGNGDGGRTDGGTGIPQIRTPITEDKDGMSLANQKGGAGGGGYRRRGLKGTTVVTLQEDVVVSDQV